MKPLIKNGPIVASLDRVEGIQDDLIRAPHGGDLTAASLATGIEPGNILDFSVNINPLGPPDCVQEICSQAIRLLKEYPDPFCREFKRALSDALEVSTDWITVGNGSTELIYLLPHLFDRGKEILIVEPCFSEYERAFRQGGKTVRHFALDPSNGFSLPIDKFIFQLRQFSDLGGIVIGHPNNPTGTLLDEESFRALYMYCERKGVFLFIDETFIDFAAPGRSFLKYIASSPHLVLIRSMTKFFSLPGLRLGFGIMNPERVNVLQAHQPPWSVNTLAQAIGPNLLKNDSFSKITKKYVQRENEFLFQNLSKIPSIEVFQSAANFLLFRLLEGNEAEAENLYETLLHQGLVLRNCGNFYGLDPRFFRLAVRSRSDNQLLISRIHEYFQLNGV